MSVISYETAVQLSYAHREIQTCEKLLKDLRDDCAKMKNLDYRDAFGHRANIQLQVPYSSSSSGSLTSRCFDIKPELALAVIEAHLADCRARIAVLSMKAKVELESEVAK